PLREPLDRLEQRLPETRELVLHARRDLGKHCSRDQSVALETTQRERQHALRDALDRATQVTETHGAIAEQVDDLNAPLVAHAIEDFSHRGTFLRLVVPW